ncbi:MAG: MerR family transcriptional regulator [Bacteroidales bacterium]|nr:MerR family transcriptional regulator [Bacteroidales bacterium]
METTELQPGKLFYSISEVADILGENVSLVRFWSDYFTKYVKPKRTQNKKNRIYDEDAIRNLQLIHYLVKEQGMTLEGAARRLDENKEGLDNKSEVINRLKGIRAELQRIYDTM